LIVFLCPKPCLPRHLAGSAVSGLHPEPYVVLVQGCVAFRLLSCHTGNQIHMKKVCLPKQACLRKQNCARSQARFAKASARRGFTLAEILIVVMILAFILVLFLLALRNQIIKGNDMTRKTDLGKIQKVLEEYYNDKKAYPTTPPTSPIANCGSADLVPYINKVPCDPVKKIPYYYISNIIGTLTPQSGYVLCTTLENRSDPDITRVGCHPVVGCGWPGGEGYNYCVSAGATPAEPDFDPDAYTPEGESLTPTPTPPWIDDKPWACTPGGLSVCNSYDDPIGAGCPFVYTEGCVYDGAYQCTNPANRCTNW
jgi:prepilin-type N-terminal cleavage/methylation domain-containing protein